MRKISRVIAGVAASAAMVTGAGALGGAASMATAQAATGPVALGGGSGIIITEQHSGEKFLCSLSAVGRDRNNNLIALTAGHCGKPGDKVASEYFEGQGDIGTFTHSWESPDVAVIDLDDSKVTPLRTVGGTTINRIGTAPLFGQPVCKEGRSTGRTCAWAWGQDRNFIVEQTCAVGGDSGGPLVRGDELVGLISWGPEPWCNQPFPAPFHAPDWSTNIADAMNVINSQAEGFTLA
ncbi:S1 family peptidase [Corynebacterium heidelbergense]|nr:S1 family peptidase [Corynebacterium heidelbergense]